MGKDWYFKDEDSICHFRTAGILIRDGKILVQREKDGNEYALPGGHVHMGETTEQSLVREYKEETGADIVCERLVWVEEVFWKWNDKAAHGIVFYYLITLKNNSNIPDEYFMSHKDNCNLILEWVSIEEMKKLTIYPAFIKEKIENISENENIEHFISYE